MKKYLYGIICVVLISIFYSLYNFREKMIYYKNLYSKEYNNVKAYEQRNSLLNGQIREFKYSMDELRSSKDSIQEKLINVIDSLKIKDKNIKYLQYESTVIHKTDTLVIKGDTIFKDLTTNIDTVIGDAWYNLKLKLQYPSTIITTPTFYSEKYVIINTHKEYNKKPSKIFFIRWFQKKHTVVTVDVVEKNPYINSKENRFINIVND